MAHRAEMQPGRGSAWRSGPSVAVVVPAHQAAHQLGACLQGLLRAGFAADETFVVDDGSADGTGDVARRAGVRVLRNEAPLGPAEARNAGVSLTRADIVVFCDADVVPHPGARDRLLGRLVADPRLSAVFGSYDDRPPALRTVSQYRNLLHHFVHQRGRPEASTFWTGFGAVRRPEFVRLGGLDPAWQNIEDVEFGLRLKQSGGRILLDRDLLCTHLKEWTVGSMFRTDWKGRAIPWTRLVMFRGLPGNDLNLSGSHKISAASVAVLPPSLAAAMVEPGALLLVAACVGSFALANRAFFRYLAARRGTAFALSAMPYHALHYLAAVLGYAQVAISEAPRRLLRRSPSRG
jgi:GT2 family glycosyltransferase